jgi:hypothetical protein
MDQALAHAAEFRRCLAELDVRGMMRLWKHVAPHLDQPSNERETLLTLHMARTGAESLPLSMRRYSDSWLRERYNGGCGSMLPMELRLSKRWWRPRG